MWKTIPILNIRVNDDIDWNNINYGSVATIITVATVFLVSIRLMIGVV